MWDFISPVNLIRYLLVWRVNSSLVQLPRCLPTALSQVVGTMIANRLPTQRARAWRKALGEQGDSWPIEAVLFTYPGKRTYGPGETILWELKLLGDSADHGLFLELILPALEEAASTTDPQWHHSNSLWGRFDIQAVYAARGARWEPVVSEGRLDLSYRASPTQWAEGLTFGLDLNRHFRRLTWITPVDFGWPILEFGLLDAGSNPKSKICSERSESIQNPKSEEPTFQDVLNALMDRMALFLPGKKRTAQDVWARLSSDEQTAISLALQQAKPVTSPPQALEPAPKEWPGRWIGTQTFTIIPAHLLPYLELASILHIGKWTHFGCGTFMLT